MNWSGLIFIFHVFLDKELFGEVIRPDKNDAALCVLKVFLSEDYFDKFSNLKMEVQEELLDGLGKKIGNAEKGISTKKEKKHGTLLYEKDESAFREISECLIYRKKDKDDEEFLWKVPLRVGAVGAAQGGAARVAGYITNKVYVS